MPILQREEAAVQIMAVGGDVESSMAFIDKLVGSTRLCFDEAAKLVIGRLIRGQPIRG